MPRPARSIYDRIRSGKLVVHVHGTVTPDPVLRFWAQLTKDGPVHPVLGTRCWTWLGCKIPKGYGYLRIDGRSVYAHRFSYRLRNPQEDINDKQVLHRCDNPSCVNPGHLFSGTNEDNRRDSISKRRHARGNRNGMRKMDYRTAQGIRETCIRTGGTRTVREIADELGLSIGTVYNVVNGVSWKDSGVIGEFPSAAV